MCNFKEHFQKNNKWYSFGLLLILTLMVAYLFIKVEALEYDIDRQLNEPNINHSLTIKELQKVQEKDKEGEPLVVAPYGGTSDEPIVMDDGGKNNAEGPNTK